MQKMTIVFPGSFMNYREIDPDMYEEYLAVMETGLFDILLFNFDEWLAGDKFRITGTENSPSKAIYRGWMLIETHTCFQMFIRKLEMTQRK